MNELMMKKAGKLTIKVYKTRDEMGRAAAEGVAAAFSSLLKEKKEVNIVFAAAPSQVELYKYLLDSDIDFTRVNAFHMDEYIGLPKGAPQSFGNYLKANLFSKAPFKSVNCIDGTAENPQEECERYAQLLSDYPPDIVCNGIGENGHLAFIDPPTADFNDPLAVKIVAMDEICRQQQVNDGCFKSIDFVPQKAITLTIPKLLKGVRYLPVVVPGPTKITAVKNTVLGEISTKCPASVLREYDNAVLFLDEVSAGCIL